MKNIAFKIMTGTLLGLVLPFTACFRGGTDADVKKTDEQIVMHEAPASDECPDCNGDQKECPDCSDNDGGDKCPDCPSDGEKPHFERPRHGGRRKRRGRIVRPIPAPIEDRPL